MNLHTRCYLTVLQAGGRKSLKATAGKGWRGHGHATAILNRGYYHVPYSHSAVEQLGALSLAGHTMPLRTYRPATLPARAQRPVAALRIDGLRKLHRSAQAVFDQRQQVITTLWA